MKNSWGKNWKGCFFFQFNVVYDIEWPVNCVKQFTAVLVESGMIHNHINSILKKNN